MRQQLTNLRDLLHRRAAFGEGQQLTRQMCGVLRRLARLRQEREQRSAVGWRFNLRQADVAGNNGQNVIQVVCDTTRQCAE